MKKIPGILLALTLVASLGVVSCAAPGSSGSPTGNIPAGGGPASTGILEVRVTDAPPQENVTSIMLTVSKLAIHRAIPGEELTSTVAPTSTNATATVNATVTPTIKSSPGGKENQTQDGWITIPITGNQTFDLIKLKGIEELLGTQKLDAGKYTQVRLTVDSAQVTIGNGTPEPATVPSGELKFVHPFDIVANKTTVIVMDFDAEKSVNIAGNGKVMIKPVVKLITKDKDDKPKGNTSPTPTVSPTPTSTPSPTTTSTAIYITGLTLVGVDTVRRSLYQI
jgi:hypothetical protein